MTPTLWKFMERWVLNSLAFCFWILVFSAFRLSISHWFDSVLTNAIDFHDFPDYICYVEWCSYHNFIIAYQFDSLISRKWVLTNIISAHSILILLIFALWNVLFLNWNTIWFCVCLRSYPAKIPPYQYGVTSCNDCYVKP